MATILDERLVGDGYDVRVMLRNNNTTVFHFLSKPDDVQAEVDKLEENMLAPTEYNQAKTGAVERLNAWYQNQLNAGISVGAFVMKSNVYDQSRLAALATGVNTALIAQVLTLNDQVPSPIWDINSVPHVVTVGDFLGMVLTYMDGLGRIEGQYATYSSLIDAATTAEELEAIILS